MHDEREKVPETRSLAARLLRPKVALPLTLLVLALLSPLIIRGWNLSRIADLDEPTLLPRAPSVATPEDDTALHHFRFAVEKSVGPYYEVALEIYPDVEDFVVRDLTKTRLPPTLVAEGIDRVLVPEQVLGMIERNAEALKHWSFATRKPLEPTKDTLYLLQQGEGLPQLNFLFSLSILHSEWLQTEGRLDEAWNAWLSVYQYHQFQTWVSDGSMLDSLLRQGYFSERMQAWMVDRFARLVSSPDITPELSRRMLADLDAAREQASDLNWRIERSYELMRLGILHYHKSISTGQYSIQDGSIAGKDRIELYIHGEPEISLRVLKHHYAWLRLWFAGPGKHQNFEYRSVHSPEEPRLPYKYWFTEIARQPDLMSPGEIEAAYLTNAVCLRGASHWYEWRELGLHHNVEQVQHELLRWFAAREWYRRANGSYPDSVSLLVPEYLSAQPIDPFNVAGEPLDFENRFQVSGAFDKGMARTWLHLSKPPSWMTGSWLIPSSLLSH